MTKLYAYKSRIALYDFQIMTCLFHIRGGRVVRWCWVNFQCRGRPTIWISVGQGPTALVLGAGGGCLDILLSSILSLLFLPLSGRRPDID